MKERTHYEIAPEKGLDTYTLIITAVYENTPGYMIPRVDQRQATSLTLWECLTEIEKYNQDGPVVYPMGAEAKYIEESPNEQ